VKILFVTGKGGVGKSLVAASLAENEAQLGRKVLLAEIGEESYYKDFWGLASVVHEPQTLPQGFDLALWSGESCLREYVLYYLKVQSLYKLFFENKVMRALISVAPGLSEIAILGKITSGIRKVGPPLKYDTIIVDAYATGHTLALLRTPKGMQAAIQFGPMGYHSTQIQKVLENPEVTSYKVVTLLEELPMTETFELKAVLENEFKVEVRLIANKVLEVPFSELALRGFKETSSPGAIEFVNYLQGLMTRQKHFWKLILEKDPQAQSVPLIFSSEPRVLAQKAGDALRTS
jgi:anion-transporting  ArsA/GET3 family ATPase